MKFVSLLLIAASLCSAAASNWTQFGSDAARTFTVNNEHRLSRRSVKKLQLHWKVQLENVAKELNALTVPLVAANLNTASGKGNYVFIAGSDDNVFALDAASGATVWKRHFEITAKPSKAADWLCPNALTATPAMDTGEQLLYVLDSGGQLHALNLLTGTEMQAPRTFTPPFAKAWSLNLADDVLYTATSQGCNRVLSGMYAIGSGTGEMRQFVAARYGAGIWGRAGVAVDKNGIVFAGTGDGTFNPAENQYPNTILAVDGRTLELKDYFTPKNYAYIAKKDLDMGNTTPVVFQYGRKELVAAGGKEGLLWLLDAENMGGADHSTPLAVTPLLANAKGSYFGRGFWGGLSTWTDKKGARWLYAPAWGPATGNVTFPKTYGDAPKGSIMAFQVTGPDTRPVLTPVWQSVSMAVPTPVTIANGVAFVMSDADYTVQNDEKGGLLTSGFRASHAAGHAILYALDATSGKVLFSSGDAISGFAHFSGVAVGAGQVFVVTWDNKVYAFSTK